MARKLKTYQTSLGFFDLAVAAPSMKAALEAWGADSNVFHQGAAMQSEDPDVIEATMAAPGVVLKRPVGSSGPFKEHAELPTDLAGDRSKKAGRKSAGRQPQRPSKRSHDEAADRKAALAFEKEQERRERERAKEEAARQKEGERRQHAVDKAQGAFDAARRKHENITADLQQEIEALEEKARAEEARWEKEKVRLEAALQRARG
ncbi:hypothetical protein [Bradyrhizobium valentinum]|uniref:Cell envelope biogenesis protein TolA n=1 Tax=Bradyrhizobium valentinum TaxID=1518501 RepID=A0A0R3L8U9_9BRAD|nr:hypothetical protein [Bradyrhizobium valentinum]KRR04337.1 cell envelope biogenesis protein TolA [Bradyrhizobium valentinum]